jgi:hypothetical protein
MRISAAGVTSGSMPRYAMLSITIPEQGSANRGVIAHALLESPDDLLCLNKPK